MGKIGRPLDYGEEGEPKRKGSDAERSRRHYAKVKAAKVKAKREATPARSTASSAETVGQCFEQAGFDRPAIKWCEWIWDQTSRAGYTGPLSNTLKAATRFLNQWDAERASPAAEKYRSGFDKAARIFRQNINQPDLAKASKPATLMRSQLVVMRHGDMFVVISDSNATAADVLRLLRASKCLEAVPPMLYLQEDLSGQVMGVARVAKATTRLLKNWDAELASTIEGIPDSRDLIEAVENLRQDMDTMSMLYLPEDWSSPVASIAYWVMLALRHRVWAYEPGTEIRSNQPQKSTRLSRRYDAPLCKLVSELVKLRGLDLKPATVAEHIRGRRDRSRRAATSK
jgi:hypothetical protein